MRILFVHQNYPGQYCHLAPALANRGHEVVGMGIEDNPLALRQEGVKTVRYSFRMPPNLAAGQGIHRLLAETQTKVIRGEAAALAGLKLREQGLEPDLICAHPGWGEAIFLKDIWPKARLLNYLEFYYHTHQSDVDFDPEFTASGPSPAMRIRTKNIFHLLSLEAMDAGISPTVWQRSRFPSVWQPAIRVIHDGVMTDHIRPDEKAEFRVGADGPVFRAGDEVLSFVARKLEPYRGFHSFMRALPEILAARPQTQVVIVGEEGTGYGSAPAGGGSWKEKLLGEVGDRLDLSRVHFVGMLPYVDLIQLFQVCRLHVYLTYPFVLSWSMLEAMSAGAVVLGSRTAPVEEVIRHGENGLLVDFFDIPAIARSIIDVLQRPDDYRPLRQAARETIVSRYDLQTCCLPAQIELAERVGRGEL